MDQAKKTAITGCGRCGQPEEAHKGRREDGEALAVMAALGGACTRFTASDASLVYQQHLGIASRAPGVRIDGRIGRRSALCERCGNRGHRQEGCPF